MRRLALSLGSPAAVALGLTVLAPGCGRGGQASPLSPTVSAVSEAGARARAQDQRLHEDRRRQEAGFRLRNRKVPRGG